MRAVLVAILVSGCAGERLARVEHTPSIAWDHDQEVSCVYIQESRLLLCFQPEEYMLWRPGQ